MVQRQELESRGWAVTAPSTACEGGGDVRELLTPARGSGPGAGNTTKSQPTWAELRGGWGCPAGAEGWGLPFPAGG